MESQASVLIFSKLLKNRVPCDHCRMSAALTIAAQFIGFMSAVLLTAVPQDLK